MWAEVVSYESLGLDLDHIHELSTNDRGLANCEYELDRVRFLQPIIEAALSVLCPAEREIFLLHYCDGLRQYEIAQLRNTSRQAVQERLNVARRRVGYWRLFWHSLNYISKMHGVSVDYVKNAQVAAELTLSTFNSKRHTGYKRKGCKNAQT